jgi:hypothetical protein
VTDETREAEYVVVLRARSAARYLPEGGFEFCLKPNAELGVRAARIRAFTRWVVAGDDELPRELTIEVRGAADSLDEAIQRFYQLAQPIALLTGFAANVRVGVMEVYLAYNSTSDSAERPFLEVFLPDETGGVSEGRIVDADVMVALTPALFAVGDDEGRISRALRHYELALRHWYIGGEWLALNHLFIAAETLTPVFITRMSEEAGFDKAALAVSLGIAEGYPEKSWQQGLDLFVRKERVFAGDVDTLKAAARGRNGMEHGHLALSEVNRHALVATEKTFAHIRRSILELLAVPDDIRTKCMAIGPRDVQSKRKVVRGRLVGAAPNPAQEGELYPRLEWRSSIDRVERDGNTFHFKGRETFTVRTHPAVGFQADSLAIMGRAEEGEETVQVDDLDVESTIVQASDRLLSTVGPMVESAVASHQHQALTGVKMVAFNLFCEGLALYQSADLLIKDRRPVEAVALLRGLVHIAARFEQIADPSGPGLGRLVRLVSSDLPEDKRRALEAAGQSAGVTIPDELPPPETSSIWASLSDEMGLAQSLLTGTLGAAGLHLRTDSTQTASFDVRLSPGPVTEMVASACVIAELELLKHGAALFGWTIDLEQVESLLVEARALNASGASGVE